MNSSVLDVLLQSSDQSSPARLAAIAKRLTPAELVHLLDELRCIGSSEGHRDQQVRWL
jgi:hypothetical protein